MSLRVSVTTVDSPLGPLTLTSQGGKLTGLHMQDRTHAPADRSGWTEDPEPFGTVTAQLNAYFAGKLTTFNVPMSLDGTAFQRDVWRTLLTIPYGQTISYADLAQKVGNPRAYRAVGTANGHNPIALIVPCHRVVAAGGAIGGYGGGLDRKRWLLEHEALMRQPLVPTPTPPSPGPVLRPTTKV